MSLFYSFRLHNTYFRGVNSILALAVYISRNEKRQPPPYCRRGKNR